MNVYDFDKTIFYPDSSWTFCLYLAKKYPAVFIDSAWTIAKGFYMTVKTGEPAYYKETAFSMIKYLPDVDSFVNRFWEENKNKLLSWYKKEKKPDDVIVSAGPEFLLKPLAEILGVRLIATPMDKFSGRIIGINNSGEEKVRRFRAEYPEERIDAFYSDSLRDAPMAHIAKNAFICKRGKIFPWPQ